MSLHLSSRLHHIHLSPTLALNQEVKALQDGGHPIINLSVGELDLPIIESVKQAVIAALSREKQIYPPVTGTLPLKQAIQDKLKRENQLDYPLSQIIVTHGAKQALFNICQAILNPNDEVIMQTPCWVSYPDMVQFAQAKPVFIPTTIEHQFKITPQQLAAAITAQTKLIILNSPHNPTGTVYNTSELKALAQVLLQHPNLMIISDDIYEHIVWEKSFKNILNVCPALYDRTILVNGISKSHAMTGWRMGYAAGPAAIIQALETLQSQTTAGVSYITQAAAFAALRLSHAPVIDCLSELKRKHDYVVDILQKIPGIRIQPTQGTFYIFFNIEPLLQQGNLYDSDEQFARYLLQHIQVALLPGSACYAPGHLRLSLTVPFALLKQAIKKLEDVLKNISQ